NRIVMAHEYPEIIARFYDTIYHEVREGVDNNYFLDKVLETGGKALEVGVGTGRLFTVCLGMGADIYGIDISTAMMAVLRRKLRGSQRDRVSLQNITSFRFPFKFDLIIAPFRVFMHVLDKVEQVVALNNVYDHLNPGGRFIFDLFIPDLKMVADGLKNVIDFEGEYEAGKRVKRIVSTDPDIITQLINVHFRFVWDEDEDVKQADWHVPMRFFFRYELEHLLERTKFEEYKIFGDFMEHPLDSESREFIVQCIKKR
ncbi:MAG TPA: class I SAM-dependent methyltransferase, partial [Bacteroidales bacterium]|nr:class I SAM-dependent methyltransferase [Bacteroidales bacterium]